MKIVEECVGKLPAEVLTRATLERAVIRIDCVDGYSILTAHEAGATSQKHVGAYLRLRRMVKRMGYDTVTMRAVFESGPDVLLLIVLRIRSDQALRIAARFGQASALWGDAEDTYSISSTGHQERIADFPTPENASAILARFAPSRDFKYPLFMPRGGMEKFSWILHLRRLVRETEGGQGKQG